MAKNKPDQVKSNTTLKFGEIDHVCPYCDKPVRFNILKFSSKHTCENCGTELFFRLKNSYILLTSVIGFPLLTVLMFGMGFHLQNIFEILIIGVLAYFYSQAASLLLCKIKGPLKVYVVDPIDPTVLNRKPRK